MQFMCINGKRITSKPGNFSADHEEAESLIGFHLSKISGNSIIKSCDTDVLVLLIGLIGAGKLPLAKTNDESHSVVMQCSASDNDCAAYIDVN